MRNVLVQDYSIRENAKMIQRGTYPQVAKQLARQLEICLDELAKREKTLTQVDQITRRLERKVARLENKFHAK